MKRKLLSGMLVFGMGLALAGCGSAGSGTGEKAQADENGNYPKSVSLSTLMRIAEKLNVSISKLLEDIENK